MDSRKRDNNLHAAKRRESVNYFNDAIVQYRKITVTCKIPGSSIAAINHMKNGTRLNAKC